MVDIRHHKSLPVYIRPNLVDLGQMLSRSYVEFSFGKLVPGNGVVKFFHPLVHHNKKNWSLYTKQYDCTLGIPTIFGPAL